MTTKEIFETSKRLKSSVAIMSSEQKTSALINIAAAIEDDMEAILRAYNIDLSAVRGTMSSINASNLQLSEEIIGCIAENYRQLAKSPDLVGATENEFIDGGHTVKKVAVPTGVIAVIADNPIQVFNSVSLILKSGSVIIVKADKHFFGTVRTIINTMRKGLKKAGISLNVIGLVEDVSSDSDRELFKAVGYVDLLICFGSRTLMDEYVFDAAVPWVNCCEDKLCQIFIDENSDEEASLKNIERSSDINLVNAKGKLVCLIHKDITEEFLPRLHARMVSGSYNNKIKLLLDSRSHLVLGGWSNCEKRSISEFIKSDNFENAVYVKTVDGVKDAVNSISAYSSGHGDGIVSHNADSIRYFMRAVDSAAVFVNSPLNEENGVCFGVGKCLGFSSRKTPISGPVGLKQLMSYKYIVTKE